mgnify:CR=1 FL=1
MVPPVDFLAQLTLTVDRPAELAAPYNQRVVEHASLFEILN